MQRMQRAIYKFDEKEFHKEVFRKVLADELDYDVDYDEADENRITIELDQEQIAKDLLTSNNIVGAIAKYYWEEIINDDDIPNEDIFVVEVDSED